MAFNTAATMTAAVRHTINRQVCQPVSDSDAKHAGVPVGSAAECNINHRYTLPEKAQLSVGLALT